MKGLRAVEICILAWLLLLLGWIAGSGVHSAPVPSVQRGVAGGLGFPSFFDDIRHQFGSIGHDLRKLVTSLMGATQVVYWKHPIQRTPSPVRRRADYSHRQNTPARPPPARVQPTKRQRRKKAYTGGGDDDDDDYADFFSLDSFGLW